MRKFVAIGAAVLLTLAIAAPLATAGTTTAPKTVTGSFIGTYSGDGGGGAPVMFRFEVRTDASGAVQFGYYQQQPLPDPNGWSSVGVVDSVRFFRDASGAKAARLNITECNIASGECNDQAVVTVTDGKPDTFCGGESCQWPYSIDDGNIAIFTTGGQNGQ